MSVKPVRMPALVKTSAARLNGLSKYFLSIYVPLKVLVFQEKQLEGLHRDVMSSRQPCLLQIWVDSASANFQSVTGL
jgi:hypothetical protein